MTEKKKIAVVGAGISGLTCAYELQNAGFDVTVMESRGQVGGRMSSRVKDDFIFDLGADHLCNLYVEMKKYCKEFGIEWEPMRFLKYGVFRDGEVLSMKDVIGKLSKVRLTLQYLSTRDVGNFFNLNELAQHDKDNAYDFMKRRTGLEVSDYFVDAFTSTYQFHRSDEISLGALFGIMQSINRDQKGWDLHRTKGGMQALPDAFADRLNVRLDNPVKEVEGGEQVTVDGEKFDAVVLASQANRTKKFYKNPTQEQKKILDSAKYAESISVAFRVDRSKLPDTAIVWVPYVQSEKISGYVNEAMKGEQMIHDGKSLVCVWLHEEYAKMLSKVDDDKVFDAVKKEFVRVCPWFQSVDEIESFDLERWPEAMPKFYNGYLKTAKEFIEGEGQGAQNVFFTGDYLNSPWTEGALRCGQRVAKQVTEKLLS
ncbi:FAD-dependent oxidoreductase [Candidatus Uhrbacteria bacterium]|jgi:protoporphyrinogen/coproporphyrinogen III oxidase|nr:FAD-dependent oxidoreductase [Candidatus Uhrbacteria bacterium]